MKDLIGKKCKIHIKINNKDLFYTADILDFNNNSILFSDKFGVIYYFKTAHIVEIHDGDADV